MTHHLEMVGPEEYKAALRKFGSGITVVTVSSGSELHGMTASAFASVSLDPPLISVCLEKTSHTRALVIETGSFAVNILAATQEDIARSFAHAGPKPFDRLAHRTGADGAPLLEGAIAWIECAVRDVFDGGDHDIVIGEVRSGTTNNGDPLLYYERAYRLLKDA